VGAPRGRVPPGSLAEPAGAPRGWGVLVRLSRSPRSATTRVSRYGVGGHRLSPASGRVGRGGGGGPPGEEGGRAVGCGRAGRGPLRAARYLVYVIILSYNIAGGRRPRPSPQRRPTGQGALPGWERRPAGGFQIGEGVAQGLLGQARVGQPRVQYTAFLTPSISPPADAPSGVLAPGGGAQAARLGHGAAAQGRRRRGLVPIVRRLAWPWVRSPVVGGAPRRGAVVLGPGTRGRSG